MMRNKFEKQANFMSVEPWNVLNETIIAESTDIIVNATISARKQSARSYPKDELTPPSCDPLSGN